MHNYCILKYVQFNAFYEFTCLYSQVTAHKFLKIAFSLNMLNMHYLCIKPLKVKGLLGSVANQSFSSATEPK